MQTRVYQTTTAAQSDSSLHKGAVQNSPYYTRVNYSIVFFWIIQKFIDTDQVHCFCIFEVFHGWICGGRKSRFHFLRSPRYFIFIVSIYLSFLSFPLLSAAASLISILLVYQIINCIVLSECFFLQFLVDLRPSQVNFFSFQVVILLVDFNFLNSLFFFEPVTCGGCKSIFHVLFKLTFSCFILSVIFSLFPIFPTCSRRKSAKRPLATVPSQVLSQVGVLLTCSRRKKEK